MWKVFKLGDICELITKGTTPTSVGFKFQKEGINFVKIESIDDNGKFINSKLAKVSNECHEHLKRSQLAEDDILFSIAGALGYTAIVTSDILPANTNQALAILRLKKDLEIDKRFLLYLLNSETVKEQTNVNKAGVAQMNLSLSQLKNYIIKLPTYAEQQRIVAKFDTAFAEINKIIKLSEVKDEEVDRLKIAFISSLVSDNNWKTIILGNVIDIVMGQAPPGKKCNKNGIGIPFVKAGEFGKISPVIREWTTEPKKYGEKSDIFLCVVGATCGKINYGTNCAIGRSVAALKPDCKKINQKFLYYFMSQKVQQLRKGSLGAAQTVISKDMINNLPISLPSLNEQEDIVIKLDKGVAEIDAIKNSVTKNKTDYFNLKNKILNKELSWEVYE